MMRRKSKSQTFTEYAFLIAIAVGALTATKVYLLRGVQQKYRESADVFGQGEQYAAGLTLVTSRDGSTRSIPRQVPPRDTCTFVVAQVNSLEDRADSLNARIGALEQESADALERIPVLQREIPELRAEARSLRDLAEQKEAEVDNLTSEAAQLQVRINEVQEMIDEIKEENKVCFDGTLPWWWQWWRCLGVRREVEELERGKAELVSQKEEKEAQATAKNNEARDFKLRADAKEERATAKQMEIRRLQAISRQNSITAANYRREANEKRAEANRYRNEHPDCFE